VLETNSIVKLFVLQLSFHFPFKVPRVVDTSV